MKKTLLLGCAVVAVLALPSSSMAAQGFGGCALAGNATFDNPLKVNQPAPPAGPDIDWGPAFRYSFTGDLSNCKGSGSAPASGKIYAGVATVTIGGTDYDFPFGKPTGNGGCSGSHTEGTALVLWDGGTASAIDYSTDGAAALVGLTGSFMSGSLTLNSAAKDSNGNPVSTTTLTLAYGGDYTGGPLAFQPPDPTACNGAGVAAAGISGAIMRGNYS